MSGYRLCPSPPLISLPLEVGLLLGFLNIGLQATASHIHQQQCINAPRSLYHKHVIGAYRSLCRYLSPIAHIAEILSQKRANVILYVHLYHVM